MPKNRHVIAALLIAPILSIMSYFSVDYLVSEQPKKAQRGMAYELIPKPNCRYQSGVCEMKNGDFEIAIIVNRLQNGDLEMSLTSEYSLKGVGISISDGQTSGAQATHMQPKNQNRQEWSAILPSPPLEQNKSTLRVAVSANESYYYAESGLAFVAYKTAFAKDFR